MHRERYYRVWVTASKSGWFGADDYDTFDWGNRMRKVSSIHFPLDSFSGKDISCQSICENDYYAQGWLGANYENDKLVSRDYILMEYINQLDKKGNKVFDGDILNNEIYGNGVVKYEKILSGFYIDFGGEDQFQLKIIKECTIIGNIYENPELIS